MSYSIPASLISNTVLTYSYLSDIADDFGVLSVHNHSGSLGEGASVLYSASQSSDVTGCLMYRVERGPAGVPDNGFISSFSNNAPANFSGRFTGGTTAMDAISSSYLPRGSKWIVHVGRGFEYYNYLYPGTYILDVYYVIATSHGDTRVQNSSSTLIGTISGSGVGASSLAKFSTCVTVPDTRPYSIEFKNDSALTVMLSAWCMRWTSS